MGTAKAIAYSEEDLHRAEQRYRDWEKLRRKLLFAWLAIVAGWAWIMASWAPASAPHGNVVEKTAPAGSIRRHAGTDVNHARPEFVGRELTLAESPLADGSLMKSPVPSTDAIQSARLKRREWRRGASGERRDNQ